ncbi:hypothetical protein FS837_002520 [Tulasnella sp. UAMH 9824]|nr:hypothetical protein FS837_002520 [Tulasnella sp. UAMH 9824]
MGKTIYPSAPSGPWGVPSSRSFSRHLLMARAVQKLGLGLTRRVASWFPAMMSLDDLYKRQNHLYGDHETNSSVLRVHRLGDGAEFVAKVIDKEHITMALKELDAFKILGYHPYITQFVESFYDKLEGIHHIVLEPAQMDLLTHVSRMRPHKQRTLASQARQITAQASSAIGHIHSYQIAHRDIKPENLLISVAESGDINLRVCDFGLARVKSQPVSEKEWFTGTPDWMAPASFRTYTSDDRRTAAFNTIINAGIDKTCLSFLQNLLVDDPDKCMDIRELLQHPYLMEAVSKLAT